MKESISALILVSGQNKVVLRFKRLLLEGGRHFIYDWGVVVLLPGDPGGPAGSRRSSYETCLDRQARRVLATARRWWEDRLEGAGTFQKAIWDYQGREEIITKGTGRESQS